MAELDNDGVLDQVDLVLDTVYRASTVLDTALEQQDLQAMRRAARLFDEAAAGCPVRYPGYPVFLYNAGTAWQHAFDASGDPADLDRTIEVLREGERAARDGPHLGQLRYGLAVALRRRGDLDESLSLLESALLVGGLSDPDDARLEHARVLRERGDSGPTPA